MCYIKDAERIMALEFKGPYAGRKQRIAEYLARLNGESGCKETCSCRRT